MFPFDQQHTQNVSALLEQLSVYSNEQLNARPKDGGWSPLQVLHHLILSETLSLQYVKKKISFGGPFETVGLKSHWAGFLLRFYLNTPIKFKAPPMVTTEKLPEYSTLEAAKTQWLAIREEWKNFFTTLAPELHNKAIYKHPVGGRLGWKQLYVFFATHTKRHEKQIFKCLGV